jgi:hypothetical protein
VVSDDGGDDDDGDGDDCLRSLIHMGDNDYADDNGDDP